MQRSGSGLRLLCAALCSAATSLAASEVSFSPVPVPVHVYGGGWEHFVGGGLAVFDCDGDLYPEMYAAGGENPAQLFRNKGTRALGFDIETPEILQITGVTGAYPLDINGDDYLDLVILRVGPDKVMQGLGDCQFAPMTEIGFQTGDHWTTAFSATWQSEDTLPTLAFGTYVDRTDPDGPFEACDESLLYVPEGPRYSDPIPLAPGYCALSMLFSNWSRNGQADLRISNDRHYYVRGGQEQLWAMQTPPRLYTETDGWTAFSIWGMGIASRDLTGDGYPEVYLTSMGDQKLQFFEPASGGPVWRDATFERGTTAHRPHVGGDGRPSTGWHAAFGDVNNDSHDDIFIAKGNVEQMPDAAMQDPNSLLLQGPDGQFREHAGPAGIASMARGRGAALVDLNLDGALDVAVVNRRAPLEVYRNDGVSGAWLLVDLRAPAPNTRAVGAFIEVALQDGRRLTREVTIGGGHAGGDAGLHHIGLGQAERVAVRVIWPGGSASDWQEVAVNQILLWAR